MAVIDSGSSSSGKANVNANFQLEVHTPTDESQAGFVQISSEVDAGDVLASRLLRSPEADDDFRLRVAIDQTLFNNSFEGTIIARDRIQQNDTTATCAQASGFLTLNSGGSTTSGQGTNIRTYRTFPLFGSYPTYGEIWARITNSTGTNALAEFGFGYCSGVTAQLTDGVFFRVISGGTLRAITCFNSNDTVVTDITTTNIPSRDGTGVFDIGEVNHYVIATNNDTTEFWINDVLVARQLVPNLQGSPTSSGEQPLFARLYNSGAASLAKSIGLGFLTVGTGSQYTGKPWSHAMAGTGGGAYQIQPGTTSGPTVTRGAVASAGWPNSATARAAGTWTATSAPAVNSLGGQWVSPAISTLTSEADYPIFAYQNPAGSATLPGKTLYITGVKWGNTVALTAAATNPINLNYIIGVGSTGSGTAVTEAAAAVAARGIVIDTIPFKTTAAIGDYVPGGNLDLTESPLVVPPGLFLHFIVRPFGTVTTNTLTVAGSIAFTGYYE